MSSRVVTVFLLTGLLLATVSLLGARAEVHLPGNHQGYEPVQPIAYSHRLHAGELGINCLYCHSGAEKSRQAGIPAANVCMNCHRQVTAPFDQVRAEEKEAAADKRKPRLIVSAELRKLYDSFGLDENLKEDPARPKRPLEWVRVHQLPDFVAFDHRPHVAAGVTCQTCHGPSETMERVRQVEDLSMGWCVNCHRAATEKGVGGKPAQATTDCAACHY
ncbi:MAG: hypothetical protein HY719_04365 [Planctomycetes bacterium]|nr:hypothetical protein [Planctomycetota bacterium]